jgi:hypothetical protein
MPATYSISGVGPAANTTANTAGIVKCEQGATLSQARIYEIEWGAQANSNDFMYTIRAKRQTSTGTWTAQTPAPLDTSHYQASFCAGGINSTIAGAASTVLCAGWGFHQRAGFRWNSVPNGELAVAVAANNGIIVEYLFAQSTDSGIGTIWVWE